MIPKTGTKAPKISLPDQDGKTRTLKETAGKWTLLYFYPKDDTPGCTIEAKGIRDQWNTFKERDIEVYGISTDPVAKHAKFAEKHALPFTLLADEGKEVVKSYGVWGKKKFMGREYIGTKRMSFLVAPDGKIAKVYEKVKPALHAKEVLEDIEELS